MLKIDMRLFYLDYTNMRATLSFTVAIGVLALGYLWYEANMKQEWNSQPPPIEGETNNCQYSQTENTKSSEEDAEESDAEESDAEESEAEEEATDTDAPSDGAEESDAEDECQHCLYSGPSNFLRDDQYRVVGLLLAYFTSIMLFNLYLTVQYYYMTL